MKRSSPYGRIKKFYLRQILLQTHRNSAFHNILPESTKSIIPSFSLFLSCYSISSYSSIWTFAKMKWTCLFSPHLTAQTNLRVQFSLELQKILIFVYWVRQYHSSFNFSHPSFSPHPWVVAPQLLFEVFRLNGRCRLDRGKCLFSLAVHYLVMKMKLSSFPYFFALGPLLSLTLAGYHAAVVELLIDSVCALVPGLSFSLKINK